jgi:putative ABC transport system permease protein
MRFLDLISLIVENLGRRKGRVVMTAIGVVIGTAAVVILVSLAIGLQQNYTSQIGGIGDLTQIQVYPNYGDMYSEKAVSGNTVAQTSSPAMITSQTISDLQAIPGVVTVVARDYIRGQAVVKYGELENYPNIIGMTVSDLSQLGFELKGGTLELARGTAVIGAPVQNNFYNPRQRPGQEMPEPPDLLDKNVKLVLTKWNSDGTTTNKTVMVRIVGVIPESRAESDYSMYMSMEDVTAYSEWFQGKRINRAKEGYSDAIVKVDSTENVLDIAEQIKTLGYQANTPQSFIEGVNSYFMILQIIFGGVGAVALLVAAIGIANTMSMAILERTREIGLMKAVGATNRDVLSVFLGESAGIGLLGGLGGELAGWVACKALNVVMLSYLTSRAAQMGSTPPTQAISTPPWLMAFTLVFAMLVGLISGLYPSLRAATLVPVTALKYE